MLVSLFCDASFSHAQKVGGWGCWIKSNRGQVSGGGPFKTPMNVSNEAELCAVINAVHLGLKRGIIQSEDTVFVQSDCMRVIHLLQGRRTKLTPVETSALAKLANLERKQRLTFRCRWVKGHSRGKTRHWCNNQCDKIAGAGMNRATKS